MSQEKKYKIAAHIQAEVQFFSLEPLLAALKKRGYNVEIALDMFENDASVGYREMAKGVCEVIRSGGFTPRSLQELKDETFDVYLTPYFDGVVQAKYYLKFEYGTLNIKPNLTYIPEVLERYHGFLCQSSITYELLKAYGATFKVDNLRFYGLKREIARGSKKRLLFAPTYNDQYNAEELTEIIHVLKKKYYVVVKGHHGTSFLRENKEKKNSMEELADEFYDSSTSLSKLIMSSDVCLFDNSSAIGEALYAGVPCAVIAKDLDYFKIGEMHTTQYELVNDGILPYTDKINSVASVVDAALDEECKKRQKELARILFQRDYKTGVDGYIEVIEKFLTDKTVQDYCLLHDLIIKEKDDLREELRKAREANEEMRQGLKERDRWLDNYTKGKLYKLADKLYKLEGKILNGES